MSHLIVQVRATKDSETGTPPSTDIMLKMLAYKKSLSEASVNPSANGLLSSPNGTRINFVDGSGNITVTPGPFNLETVMSGYWIFGAKDLKERNKMGGGRRRWRRGRRWK